MILVDTSVWIDHLRRDDPQLKALLLANEVLTHPFIIGEVACGSLQNRSEILQYLSALPEVRLAEHSEVLRLIEKEQLYHRGIGLVDAYLIASARLSHCRLWTRDKQLAAAAVALGISH
jgi:predicted nucleic acid-binding protein